VKLVTSGLHLMKRRKMRKFGSLPGLFYDFV